MVAISSKTVWYRPRLDLDLGMVPAGGVLTCSFDGKWSPICRGKPPSSQNSIQSKTRKVKQR